MCVSSCFSIAGLGPLVAGDAGAELAGQADGPGRAPALAARHLGAREEIKEHRLPWQGRADGGGGGGGGGGGAGGE